MEPRQIWSIVLAAGDGTRLRTLTTSDSGVVVPKQFCGFNGGGSLLHRAVRRGASVARPDRTMVVVAAAHRRWWQAEIGNLPPSNVLVQPSNRGTAAGLLLPLLTLRERDPNAVVLVLPSDHFVTAEHLLRPALVHAAAAAAEDQSRILLLGVRPDCPDTGYGWISSGPPDHSGLRPIRTFLEKPLPPIAEQCLRRGDHWNSFILAATVDALLGFFARLQPWLLARFAAAFAAPAEERERALRRIYDQLPRIDFSADMLAASEGGLWMLPMPECGWTDLGTPERVGRCIAALVQGVHPEHQSERPLRGRLNPAAHAPLNVV